MPRLVGTSLRTFNPLKAEFRLVCAVARGTRRHIPFLTVSSTSFSQQARTVHAHAEIIFTRRPGDCAGGRAGVERSKRARRKKWQAGVRDWQRRAIHTERTTSSCRKGWRARCGDWCSNFRSSRKERAGRKCAGSSRRINFGAACNICGGTSATRTGTCRLSRSFRTIPRWKICRATSLSPIFIRRSGFRWSRCCRKTCRA